ncbi:MAG: pilus assembly protein PilZ [Spirochaetia bacterium]|jgi:hypothetical protein|nr:pilus assembly protein PilZ [Spirochaetia bacterium]
MAILTSLQISKLYELYNEVDITFTKDIVAATQLNQKEIYVRCGGVHRKCLLYSTSMKKSRIIVNTGDNFISLIRESGNLVSLRICFNIPNKNDKISFFVNARVTGYSAYTTPDSDLNYAFLSYTQRPPDDLIITLGQLLEANINFQKRKNLRIIVNQNNYKLLGLNSREVNLVIENIPRKVILVDISTSGIMTIGVKAFKFHLNKSIIIKFSSGSSNWQISGKIARIDNIPGRKDVVLIGIEFTGDTIPVSFKISIENYVKTLKELPASAAAQSSATNEASAPDENKAAAVPSEAAVPPEAAKPLPDEKTAVSGAIKPAASPAAPEEPADPENNIE